MIVVDEFTRGFLVASLLALALALAWLAVREFMFQTELDYVTARVRAEGKEK